MNMLTVGKGVALGFTAAGVMIGGFVDSKMEDARFNKMTNDITDTVLKTVDEKTTVKES